MSAPKYYFANDGYDLASVSVVKKGFPFKAVALGVGVLCSIFPAADSTSALSIQPYNSARIISAPSAYNGNKINSRTNIKGMEENGMVRENRNKLNSTTGRVIKSSVSRNPFVYRELNSGYCDEKVEKAIINRPFDNGRVVKSSISRGFVDTWEVKGE